MKSYNVKILRDENRHHNFVVEVENEVDFIEWFKILSSLEGEKVVFSEISKTEENKETDF
tara:strand:- start:127 stop:306 length:180 start_codon:yes stop_codon:yes gene_type:complete